MYPKLSVMTCCKPAMPIGFTFLVVVSLSALFAIMSPTSFAQESNTEAAKKLHDAYVTTARVLYGEQKFKEAIEQFEKALDAFHEPKLYFNLAQACRLANEPEKALVYYRKFLEALPSISLPEAKKVTAARDANRWIDHIEGEKREQKRREQELAEQKRREQKQREQELAEQKRREQAPVTTPEVAPSTGLTSRWWFWTGLATTALLAGGTVWAGLRAQQYNDAWKKDWIEDDRDKTLLYQDITDIALAGAISMGIVVSVVSYLHVKNADVSVKGETSPVTFFPGCDGHGCMVTLTWSF